jgi:hypothetical protein
MQNISWVDLPRIEKTNTRLSDDLFQGIVVKNLSYGINLYKNVIPKNECDNIISVLENKLSNSQNNFDWHKAQINNKENNIYNRNCFDFKYKRDHLGKLMPYDQELFDIHKTVEEYLDKALSHYQKSWNLSINYKEAFNFVKYGSNQYFKIHGDHGPYYTCTVSAVIYLNDDYEGGEIDFIRQELKIKPSVGDIVLFPSNYVYEHASCEVGTGTKYSVVVMLDYNDKYHKDDV